MSGTDQYAPTFALIDTDQDGYISEAEFDRLMQLLGDGHAPEATLDSMFAQIDTDGDGKVNLDELSAYLGSTATTD